MEYSNREKPRSRTQIHYIIREITGEEERNSQPLCIYNGMHIILLYIALMTVHLFLCRKLGLQVVKSPNCSWHVFSEFHGLRASRADCFSAMHLWDASPKSSSRDQAVTSRCYYALLLRSAPPRKCFGVLLRSDVKLLLQSETPILPLIWNSKLIQPLYRRASYSLWDLQGRSA